MLKHVQHDGWEEGEGSLSATCAPAKSRSPGRRALWRRLGSCFRRNSQRVAWRGAAAAHARSSAGACGRLRREERQADGTGRCRLGITGLPPGRHRVALATSLRVAGGVAFNLPLGPSRNARRGQGQGSRLPCPPEAIAGAGPGKARGVEVRRGPGKGSALDSPRIPAQGCFIERSLAPRGTGRMDEAARRDAYTLCPRRCSQPGLALTT